MARGTSNGIQGWQGFPHSESTLTRRANPDITTSGGTRMLPDSLINHFLTSTHFHSPAAMPAPTQLHLSHAHAQAPCAHPHASHTHTMRPFRRVCDYVACDSM